MVPAGDPRNCAPNRGSVTRSQIVRLIDAGSGRLRIPTAGRAITGLRTDTTVAFAERSDPESSSSSQAISPEAPTS